jgi:aldehyde:ferredoxin oxidoreductase
MKAADWLEQVLDEYYEHKGWDRTTGLQRREKLVELGLDDVAAVLAAENALVD